MPKVVGGCAAEVSMAKRVDLLFKERTFFGVKECRVLGWGLLLLFALATPRGSAWALTPRLEPPGRPIHLLNGVIQPTAKVSPEVAPLLRQPPAGTLHVLLQLSHIPGPAELAALARLGVELHDYIPERAWIAALPGRSLPAVAELEAVTFLKVWGPHDKLQPGLARGEVGPWAVDEKSGLINLFFFLHKDVDLGWGRQAIERQGGLAVQEWVSDHAWSCWVPREAVEGLAQLEEVYWLEVYPPPLEPTNDGARVNLNVNAVASAPYNLTGSGINVFVFDGGRARTTHEQLAGKITLVDSGSVSDHSTHVATTVAGTGTGQARARGMAPGAWILTAGYSQSSGVLFYDSYGDMVTDYSAARNTAGRPAHLATNSIGSNVAANNNDCNLHGMYGQSSRMIDRIVRGDEAGIAGSYKRYIVTWAAGNERTGGSPAGRCGGGFNTLAPPSSAKNPIHVGATNSDYDSMTVFSSWGPTASGRLKPNVTGPGCELFGEGGIYSATATNNTSYGVMCGTSMATPAVAGVVALILQDYRAQFGTTDDPLNAAVKALLMHTAKDLGPPGPDYMAGYGRVDALAAVSLLRRAVAGAGDAYFHDVLRHTPAAVNHGDTHLFTVAVPAGTAELKVTLAWDDPPSAAPSTGLLTNDLDLEVRGPSHTVHYPWVLNPAQPWLTATTGVNTADNQEQVVVRNPAPGTWTIHLKGTWVPQGPQSFGLVYSLTPDPGDTFTRLIDYDPAVANGGFETAGSWDLSGGTNGSVRDSTQARSGSWSLRLAGANNRDDRASQTHTIPANATAARLSYWLRMETADNTSGNDWMAVYVIPTDGSQQYVLDLYHNGTMKRGDNDFETPRWAEVANIDLLPWAGREVRILFRGRTGTSGVTTFWIDDVRLEIATPTPCTPPAAPAQLQAQAAGDNRIDLSWSPVSAASYRVYRATAPGGPYTQIAAGVTSTTYSDTTVHGGVTYYYVVRAFNPPTCESPNSAEAAALAQGSCTLPPTFAGLSSVGASGGRCLLELNWSAGAARCPGRNPVVYNVYRSTVANFTPGPATLLAACVTGTRFEDATAVGGTTYYYAVRAEDASRDGAGPCNRGNEDTNGVRLAGTAGTLGSLVLYAHNFDDPPSPANWWGTGYTFGNPYTQGTCASQTFVTDWHYPATGQCTGNTAASFQAGSNPRRYRNYNNGALVLGLPPAGGNPGGILLPAHAAAVTLTFNHWYSFESGGWDGGRVMLSTSWPTFSQITPVGGYPGTIQNTTTYCHPFPGQSAYTNASPGCASATFDLSAFTGQRVWLAWNLGADSSINAEGWYLDNVQLTATVPLTCTPVPQPVAALTVRSGDGTNLLEWVNPASGPYSATVIRARTDTFPTSPTDGVAVTTHSGSLGGYGSFTHTGLTNGTTYYYAAFVQDGSGYSAARRAAGRPFDTSGAVKWAYSTGATAVAPPGLRPGAVGVGAVYSFSNDRGLHGTNPTAAGGQWPRTAPFAWQPMWMAAPAQSRPGVLPTSLVPPASRVIFVGSQDGYVYAVNADTGAVLWSSPDLGAIIQAAPSGMYTQYGGSWNLLFVPTRSASAPNRVVALNPANGQVLWSFDNGGGSNAIGIIAAGATVDYSTNRLYFTSRTRTGGSNHTVWALSFTNAGATLLWSRALGSSDAAPTLYAGRLYVGTNAGEVYALDPATGATMWSYSTGGGPVKGFISPETTALPRRLVFSTTSTVWALWDNGTSASLAWRRDTIPSPSVVLVVPNRGAAVVGGGDGRLHQLRLSDGQVTSVQLGAGDAAVGSPSFDVVNQLAYVGSESGVLYAVVLPPIGSEGEGGKGVNQLPWPPGSWDGAPLADLREPEHLLGATGLVVQAVAVQEPVPLPAQPQHSAEGRQP